MNPKIDEGFCVFGAIALNRYLDALRQEIDGVRRTEGSDPIHDMRVASRRLRTTLDLFEVCFPHKKYRLWKTQVRGITKALGDARDKDVQVELLEKFTKEQAQPKDLPGLRRLNLRLKQKRESLQYQIIQALDDLEHEKTLDGISSCLTPFLDRQSQTYLYTPALYQRGYESISAALSQFLSYEPYIDQPDANKELHAMRIAAKSLRYTMEVFAVLYPGELKDPIFATRKAQDLLGDLHDCDVWIAFIPSFIEKERSRTLKYIGHLRDFSRLLPGFHAFLQDRQQKRDQAYLEFADCWNKNTELNTWTGIYPLIQIPSYRIEPQSNSGGDSHEA